MANAMVASVTDIISQSVIFSFCFDWFDGGGWVGCGSFVGWDDVTSSEGEEWGGGESYVASTHDSRKTGRKRKDVKRGNSILHTPYKGR